MEDNILECKNRILKLVGNTKENKDILDNNIICADGLTYDYMFDKNTNLLQYFNLDS